MPEQAAASVELIPINLITVVNPRVRNKKNFKEIVANIGEIGLKKPITVARRQHAGGVRYDLVCGQGRLEAFVALGQREIPAFVVDVDGENGLVMSLCENLARRAHRAIDLLHDIQGMKKRGYTDQDIAKKTGLSLEYVRGVNRLLSRGEHRLVRAVEARLIPVSVAVKIAEADDAGVQMILQQAYEENVLRGRKLIVAKRLIERRRRSGKGQMFRETMRLGAISVSSVMRTYREDSDKKRLLVRKAELAHERLVFIAQALRTLLADQSFVDLLRAEGLTTLPKGIAERITREAA